MKYTAFASYATVPDSKLVRDTEKFLESFHRGITYDGKELDKLEICVDGRDFHKPKFSADTALDPDHDPVWDAIELELTQSESLLLFCSRASVTREYVNREVEWFLQHRGADKIYLVVTEGKDPVSNPKEVFPAAIRAVGLHRQPWYDFRGYRRKIYPNVRNFDDARTTLAAHLLGKSAGEIQPLWYQQQRTRSARVTFAAVAVSALMSFLAVFSYSAMQSATKERNAKEAALVRALGLSTSILKAVDAEITPLPDAENIGRAILSAAQKELLDLAIQIDHASKDRRGTALAKAAEDAQLFLAGLDTRYRLTYSEHEMSEKELSFYSKYFSNQKLAPYIRSQLDEYEKREKAHEFINSLE